MLSAVPVLVPSEGEQTRIAAVLNAQDARIRAEEVNVEKLKALRSGLVNDLLTGRVRVKVTQEATA